MRTGSFSPPFPSKSRLFFHPLAENSLDQVEGVEDLRVRDPVKDLCPLPPGDQHAAALHHEEVGRNGPEGDIERLRDLGDAPFRLSEEIQNHETYGMREDLAHIGMVFVEFRDP